MSGMTPLTKRTTLVSGPSGGVNAARPLPVAPARACRGAVVPDAAQEGAPSRPSWLRRSGSATPSSRMARPICGTRRSMRLLCGSRSTLCGSQLTALETTPTSTFPAGFGRAPSSWRRVNGLI